MTMNAFLYKIIMAGFSFLAGTLFAHLHAWRTSLIQRSTIPDKGHPFIAPRDGVDSRSPCPALNTLANHGYLPRDGTHVRPHQLLHALRQGYNLSYPIAALLAYGSCFVLGQFVDISLGDLCRHNRIEHDASLAHLDAGIEEYAPYKCNRKLLNELVAYSSDGIHLSAADIARARVNRESSYKLPLDGMHSEIARGEMALVLGLFGGPSEKVPIKTLQEWWITEKFPAGWEPTHQQTFLKTVLTATKIRTHMTVLRVGDKLADGTLTKR